MHSSPHGLKIFCFRLYLCICHLLKRWCTQVHTDWKYSVFGCICAFATCLRSDALKSTRTENLMFSVVSVHSPPSQSRNTGINMLWGCGLCKQLYMQMRIHLFSTDNFSNLIFFYNQTHNPSVEDKFSRMCIFQCSFAKPVTNAQKPLITNTIFSLCALEYITAK